MSEYFNYWKKMCSIHEIPYNREIFKNLYNINEKHPISKEIHIDSKYQIGGIGSQKNFKKMIVELNYEKEIFIYNKKRILFFKTTEDDKVTYSIKKMNDEEVSECLFIDIEFNINVFTTRENKNAAYISSLENNGNCEYYKLNKKISGKELIDIAIEFIKTKKKEYNITTIYLKDNADKLCKGIPAERMTRVYTLLNGHTWYGSRGFLPFSSTNNKYNIEYYENYERNLILNKLLKVKHVNNLNNIIFESYIKYENNTIKKENLLEIILDSNFDKKYGETNLGLFLKYLLDNNYIDCYIYFDFANYIFNNISITTNFKKENNEIIKYTDFYGYSFYLDI